MSDQPMTALENADQSIGVTPPRSKHGHWKIGAGIFTIACIAQAALWTLWWDDPTHFKMSILFVWPAALFSLLIWWTFFSGWSANVRYGSVAAGVALLVGFFSIFKPDRVNGDMVPTRLVYRWAPTADDAARQFVAKLKSSAAPVAANDQHEVPLLATSSDWPGFRGPARDGIIRNMALRTDWSAKPPKEVWRHPIGKAWSSFAVVGDFVFTQEQRENSEAVIAYRLGDGEQLWQHLDDALFQALDLQGGVGPRATPQFDEGKLYTLGGTGVLNCLDARTGKRIWSANILKDAGSDDQAAANLEWGMSGSPLIVDQYVIVNPGGTNKKSVAAYDKETGKKVWASGIHQAGYSSPTIATLHEQRVVLVPVGTGLEAHALADGKVLWFFEWKNNPKVNSAMAVALPDNSILFGNGYGVGTVRIDIGFDREKNDWSINRRWHSPRFRPKFNDFVVYEGHIYGLDDGRLTCLDLETGDVKWKAGRYGYGQILLVDKLLLILSEGGKVILVPATPTQPEELASFSALNDETITWNHPVVVRGKLLVRNANEAACFDLE